MLIKTNLSKYIYYIFSRGNIFTINAFYTIFYHHHQYRYFQSFLLNFSNNLARGKLKLPRAGIQFFIYNYFCKIFIYYLLFSHHNCISFIQKGSKNDLNPSKFVTLYYNIKILDEFIIIHQVSKFLLIIINCGNYFNKSYKLIIFCDQAS